MFLAVLPAACEATALDSGDSAASDTALVTGDECGCDDGDCSATSSWTTSGICIAVPDSPEGRRYYFGMAETGIDEGWYGEDCLDGPGPNSGDYDICHVMVGCELCLATVRDPADVVPSETTLLTDTIASNITYLLATEADCWTWGDDTRYYTSALGCAAN
ncbi:MAG: hypothetical protein FJ102_06155 [Deltaproteobacteria bacterium]|nr:hypothetical protein [Deltaproteobacteria bacterium]